MLTDPAEAGPSAPMGRGSRLALGLVGLTSWVAGGFGVFLSENGAGAASLVAVGGAAGVLSMIGRWPSRMSFAGSELAFPEMIMDEIEVARESGERNVVHAMEELLQRYERYERTGVKPEHPAAVYDLDVERAILRVAPKAQVDRQVASRNRRVADYEVRLPGGPVLLVETKWRSLPSEPFRGSTLPMLTGNLGPGQRLLVVARASDVREAARNLEESMPGRALAVSWLSSADDKALEAAIRRLTST